MAAHGDEAGMVRVGDYLIERLIALGVEHVFGVPGDFVLGFMQDLEESPLTLVTTRWLHDGAADHRRRVQRHPALGLQQIAGSHRHRPRPSGRDDQ